MVINGPGTTWKEKCAGYFCTVQATGIIAMLLMAVLVFPCHSLDLDDQPELTANVVLDKSSYGPGDTVVAAVHVFVPSKFHLYANPLGPGIGKPVIVSLGKSDDIQWVTLRKSAPEKFTPEIGGWVWAYEKNAYFYCKGVLSPHPSKEIHTGFVLQGLMCATACIPVSLVKDVDVGVSASSSGLSFEKHPDLAEIAKQCEPMPFTVSSDSAALLAPNVSSLGSIRLNSPIKESPISWDYDPVEHRQVMNLLLAILFGFIAGIILNVMPCVLPVLGIKILSFANASGSSRKSALLRSISFAAGMFSVFMFLAALASFAHLSWGQHFQSPWFLIGLILIMVVFSLGLFDIYIVPISGAVSNLGNKPANGFSGDFFRGMLATALATPCSGPFLGATLAWTLTQPAVVIFIVFGSIGLGMAFPYILLSSNKMLLKIIPKPGKWMENFKYLMGFLLLGSATYLLFGLPKDMVAATVGFCLIAAFAIVMYSRFAPFGTSVVRKVIVALICLGILVLGAYVSYDVLYASRSMNAASKASQIYWEEFTAADLKDAHRRGQSVVVDFTASWCINCQYNLVTVLSDPSVADLLIKKKVLTLKADLTWANPPAEDLLHHLGSRSVPFLAVFRGDDPYHPIIMRDILNKSEMLKALRDLPEK